MRDASRHRNHRSSALGHSGYVPVPDTGGMRIAVFADVHADLGGLQAVLADITF